MQRNYRSGDQLAGKRVVTIGGGSGTFSLLSHLKKYPFNISAVVNMSDSGGSSRKLMDRVSSSTAARRSTHVARCTGA